MLHDDPGYGFRNGGRLSDAEEEGERGREVHAAGGVARIDLSDGEGQLPDLSPRA